MGPSTLPVFPPKIKDDKICVELGVWSVALIQTVSSTDDYKLKNTPTVHLNQPINGCARRNHILYDLGADQGMCSDQNFFSWDTSILSYEDLKSLIRGESVTYPLTIEQGANRISSLRALAMHSAQRNLKP